MKNNLKRIAIILPVIALLLAFLAVPAAADYSPETGWDAPVGTFEPFISSVTFTNNGVSTTTDVPLGTPGQISGITNTVGEFSFGFDYKYRIRIYSDYWINENYEDGLLYYDNNAGFFVRFESPVLNSEGLIGNVLLVDQGVISFGYISSDGEELFYTSWLSGEIAYIDIYVEEYPISDIEYPDGSVHASSLWAQFPFEVYEVDSGSAVEPIGNVWTGIMTWITSALTTVMGAFYVDGSLTLLGTLACIGVSVGIGFLLIGLIQRILKLRG